MNFSIHSYQDLDLSDNGSADDLDAGEFTEEDKKTSEEMPEEEDGSHHKWGNLDELQETGIIAADITTMEFVTASDGAHEKFAVVAEESIKKLLADYNARFSKTDVTSEKRDEFERQTRKSRGKGNEQIDMKLIRVKYQQSEFYQLLMAPNAESAEMYYGHLFRHAQIDILDFPGVTTETFDDKPAEVMNYLAVRCTIRKLSYEQTIGLLAILDKRLLQVELVVLNPSTSIEQIVKDQEDMYPVEYFQVKVVNPFASIQDMQYSDFIAQKKSILSRLAIEHSEHSLDLSHKTFEDM